MGSEDGERIVACRYGTAGEETTETELGATLYLSSLAWLGMVQGRFLRAELSKKKHRGNLYQMLSNCIKCF